MKGQRLFQRTVEKTHDVSCSKKYVRGYVENTEPHLFYKDLLNRTLHPLFTLQWAQIKTLYSFFKGVPSQLKKTKVLRMVCGGG